MIIVNVEILNTEERLRRTNLQRRVTHKMKIIATRRKEKDGILHCRFCKDKEGHYGVELYETSPSKGIVCDNCLKHLNSYCKLEVKKR
jgi:hypothetical protein